MSKKHKGDAMSDEMTSTEAAPHGTTPSNGQAVKLRKARGGDGVNRDFGYLKEGDEVEADVVLAARCLMGREFELIDEGDKARVEAALAELTAEKATD